MKKEKKKRGPTNGCPQSDATSSPAALVYASVHSGSATEHSCMMSSHTSPHTIWNSVSTAWKNVSKL